MKNLLRPSPTFLYRCFVLLLCLCFLLIACIGSPLAATVPAQPAAASGPAVTLAPTGNAAVNLQPAVIPIAYAATVKPPAPTRRATATARPSATDVPVISDPKTLAENVYKASNPDAQYQALLLVMRALNVGVYEARTGKAIIRGAERGPDDFYLYDFEIEAIANALNRQKSWDTAYLADFFTRAGFSSDEEPVDPDVLRQTLLAAVQSSAAAPDDPYSFVYLMVRELGLHHAVPYDMFQEVPQEQLLFDALQVMLIQADVLVPVVHESASLDQSLDMQLAMNIPQNQPVPYLGLQGLCDDMTGIQVVSPFGKYLLGLLKQASKVVLVLDMIHAEMLAYSVDVKAVSQAQSTHYGHESPGEESRFQIKVEMLDDYGNLLVNCGVLAGYQLPKKGGIPGVSVTWETGGIEKHGTVSYEPPDKKTNGDGIATLVFKPKSEKRPGQGLTVEEKGTVTGLALYQSAFGNILGSLGQLLTPKSDVIAWTVARHRNLTLEIATIGSMSIEDMMWSLEGNKLSIPLESDGTSWTGHAQADFKFTLTGICNGSSTWGTSWDITATGIDPLDFSVTTPFVPQFNFNCEGVQSPGQMPVMKASKPVNFSLPAADGASIIIGKYWKFTVKEQ